MKKLYLEKERAIQMRLRGMSYSQIKDKIKVSKSSLSLWLEKYPLSQEKIRELRDWNPRRIENCRNTKLKKRQNKLETIYKAVAKEIGSLSKRDLFIGGLFLYWGEGTKASRSLLVCTNTDPSMIKFFIKWLDLLGIERDKLKIRLHLYVDMNIKVETKFWSDNLGIRKENFKNPYIKESKFSNLTYKNGFGHGTCNLYYADSEVYNRVMMSLKYLRDIV